MSNTPKKLWSSVTPIYVAQPDYHPDPEHGSLISERYDFLGNAFWLKESNLLVTAYENVKEYAIENPKYLQPICLPPDETAALTLRTILLNPFHGIAVFSLLHIDIKKEELHYNSEEGHDLLENEDIKNEHCYIPTYKTVKGFQNKLARKVLKTKVEKCDYSFVKAKIPKECSLGSPVVTQKRELVGMIVRIENQTRILSSSIIQKTRDLLLT